MIKPHKVKCSVKVGSPYWWDDDAQDWIEIEPDVQAIGSLVEIKDPSKLTLRDFRADMVHGPDATNEDVIMTDLTGPLEAVLNGTDAAVIVAGVKDGGQVQLMDGAEGLAAGAVWQLAAELQDRQANHRANGATGFTFHMRMQYFLLHGDTIQDLLTDMPEAARLMEEPQGVVVEGARIASATSPDEFMKFLESGQRRLDPELRPKSATFLIIEATQADYNEGWGLYGKLILVESPVMNCLAEDRGLVQLREGFETFRGVYHFRTLVKNWKPREVGDVNGSAFTWLLREVLAGGSIEATVLFCLNQGEPAVSIALMELMVELGKVQTFPVTQDNRVAGWAMSVRAERLQMKQAFENKGSVAQVDKDTRSVIMELEKRLAAAERARDDAFKSADTRQSRAHDFQDKYVNALEQQEAMNERLLGSEEEHLQACQALLEAQLESSEIRDELSELQYKDNVLLMMMEQDVAEMQAELLETEGAFASLQESSVSELLSLEEQSKAEAFQQHSLEEETLKKMTEQSKDLQLRLDTFSEAKMQQEIAFEVERGSLQNRIDALRLELKEAEFDTSRQEVEERSRSDEEARQRELAVQEARAASTVELSKARVNAEEELQKIRTQVEAELLEAKRQAADEVIQARYLGEQASQEVEKIRWRHEEESQQVKMLKSQAESLRSRLDHEEAVASSEGGLKAKFDTEVQHKNRLEDQIKMLQTRLSSLEKTSPAELRAQAHRVSFLEKSLRDLEADRSELTVRATVAEEQLQSLHRHLKAMTEDYQMQILHLKLQLQEEQQRKVAG